jgi:DNA-binding MarR family transcriptional regulator
VTDKPIDGLANSLAIVIGRLNRRMLGATGGLSYAMLKALSTVSTHGPLRLAELAQLELVAAPTITRVVAELESRGLVTREVDGADRRAFRISVTADGRTAIIRARAARAEVVANLLSTLDPTELTAITSALPALERATEIGAGERPPAASE